jgi:capsular exopolysaccharide synthesis family protein
VELTALGVPMLGTAPVRRWPTGAGDGSSRLYPVNTTGGDVYRRLQGTLLFSLDRENRSVVLVAGVNNAVAATGVAANLAAMAARAGRRTLIIGADLRNDLLARHLGVEVATGLSDVIVGGASLADSIQPVEGVDNLSLLGAGHLLDRPADVLQSESFARLMSAVHADYELVVVEAPPVLLVADAVEVAGFCDGSIVVADAASETRQAIADSVDQLRGVGSEIVGVVVADAE